MKIALCVSSLLVFGGFASAAAPLPFEPPGAAPACPTINPPGTSCMPNEACIRRGGECAVTDATVPITCKCVY